jgi:hypothetical protein
MNKSLNILLLCLGEKPQDIHNLLTTKIMLSLNAEPYICCTVYNCFTALDLNLIIAE